MGCNVELGFYLYQRVFQNTILLLLVKIVLGTCAQYDQNVWFVESLIMSSMTTTFFRTSQDTMDIVTAL